jgi:hypothetical protein
MGWVLNMPSLPKATTQLISLPDQDKIAIEVTTPK